MLLRPLFFHTFVDVHGPVSMRISAGVGDYWVDNGQDKNKAQNIGDCSPEWCSGLCHGCGQALKTAC